jgi:hypothetical protein
VIGFRASREIAVLQIDMAAVSTELRRSYSQFLAMPILA